MAFYGENWADMSPEARNKYLFRDRGFDPRGNNELGTMFQQYAAALYPTVAGDINFMAGLQPRRQRAIRGMIDNLESGVEADARAYGAAADENAGQAARQAAMFGRSSGLGDGFTAGQQAAAFNQAAAQKNAYRAQMQSPAARIQRAAAILQAIEQGSFSPALNMQMGLFGPIEQRHGQNRAEAGSGSAMNMLAGSLGSMTGMGWGPFG